MGHGYFYIPDVTHSASKIGAELVISSPDDRREHEKSKPIEISHGARNDKHFECNPYSYCC